MAFKGDSDDTRESLSCKLRNLLRVEAREVLCSDPYVKEPYIVPVETAVAGADVVILGAPHSVYANLVIPAHKTVIDIWNFWSSKSVPRPERILADPQHTR